MSGQVAFLFDANRRTHAERDREGGRGMSRQVAFLFDANRAPAATESRRGDAA